jgi:glutamate racemase
MIGFLDSSFAGLEVVRVLQSRLSGYEFIFFADTARGPYTGKSFDTIRAFAKEGIQKLLHLGAKRIIITSPALSAVAASGLTGLDDVTIHNIIEPAAEEAACKSKHQHIGILGIEESFEVDVYKKMIWKWNGNAKIFTASSALIESIVAEGWMNKPQAAMIVKKYLHPLKTRQIDTLILAKPEHRRMEKMIQRKVGKQVRIVRSWEIAAEHFITDLINDGISGSTGEKKETLRVLVTDLSSSLEKKTRIFYDRKIRIEKILF